MAKWLRDDLDFPPKQGSSHGKFSFRGYMFLGFNPIFMEKRVGSFSARKNALDHFKSTDVFPSHCAFTCCVFGDTAPKKQTCRT